MKKYKMHFEDDETGRYMCRKDLYPDTKKMTWDIRKVTCDNCMATIRKWIKEAWGKQ